MKINQLKFYSVLLGVVIMIWGCKTPQASQINTNKNLPAAYGAIASDSSSSLAQVNWRSYFNDSLLVALIDTALTNNQELNIIMQEIEISKNEIRARKGEYLPFVNAGAGAGVEKPGRFTRFGTLEHELEVEPGKRFPEPLQDYVFGATASWEIDVWKKLRNAKKSAVMRYLATVEGKHFSTTQIVAEVADAYYELMALDNLLDMIEQNVAIQSNALNVVKQQKESAKVTQLAVNRFEAQLLNTQNLQYAIKQKRVETENRINFLTGRYSTAIPRLSNQFFAIEVDSVLTGVPSQLLMNRTDVKQAEFALEAAKLDVKVARANFYPRLGLRAGIGFNALNTQYLVHPESMFYNLAGDLMAPLVNRNAIHAAYNTANAKQIQSVFQYQQTLLNAYVDVVYQLNKVDNYTQSLQTKNKEVELLMQSVTIAGNLFNSARADYAEVLLTQREALDAKMDLIEIKMNQLNAKVNVYRALGGGWK